MRDERLMAEAMALVVLPYASLDGLLPRAEALAIEAADAGLGRIEALARLARVDILGRRQQVRDHTNRARQTIAATASR